MSGHKNLLALHPLCSICVKRATRLPTSAMRTGVYSWPALGRAPVGLHERVSKSRTPKSSTGARRQGGQRRPVLTLSSSSNSSEKSSASQNSLDTLDLLLNSTDPSPGMLICCVHCKVIRLACLSCHIWRFAYAPCRTCVAICMLMCCLVQRTLLMRRLELPWQTSLTLLANRQQVLHKLT